MDMKRPPARSHLPPEAAKNLERHILAESRAPKTLVGYFLDRLGGDIAMTETVEPDKLRLTLTFADKTGELGRVDAVYSGPNLSLSGLFCGVRDAGAEGRAERERVMAEIYETAKTAFAEE